MAQENYRFTLQGLGGATAASQSRASAVTSGIRVAALAGNVWPNQSNEYVGLVINELIEELISFAIAARRYLEISNIRNVEVSDRLWNVAEEVRNAEYETNLWNAVNKIVHARSIRAFTLERDACRFQNLGDRVITHVIVQSDRGPEIALCPTGLVHAFLGAEPT